MNSTEVAHSTCECAVAQIKPTWDRHGCLVCEDCYGRIPREPGKTATALLREALVLVMYGERAPGGNETWGEWARKTETYLRAADEQPS